MPKVGEGRLSWIITDKEKFKLVQEAGNMGLWEWDIPGNTLHWSPQLEKLHGKKKGGFSRTFEDFLLDVHPADKERVERSIHTATKKGKKFHFEYRIVLPSSNIRWLSSYGKIVRDKHGKAIRMYGVCTDITYQREVEKRLSIQYQIATILTEVNSIEEASATILSAIGKAFNWEAGALWRVTPRGLVLVEGWSEGRLFKRFFAASRKQIVHRKDSMIGKVWEEGKSVFIKDVQVRADFVRKHHLPPHIHTAFLVPIRYGREVLGVIEFYDNSQQILDRSAELIIESVSHQLSLLIRRIDAENVMKETSKHLNAIFQSVPEGLTVEDKNGELVYANEMVGRLFGFSNEALEKTKSIRDLLIDFNIYDREGKSLALRDLPASKVFATGGANMGIFRFEHKGTGEEMWLQVSATPVFDDEPLPYLAVKVFRNISDEIEEQRQREMYIGLVGHEIKNPLASLKAYTQLLQRRIEKQRYEDARNYLVSIDSQSDRLTKLINDLLDLTRIRANRLKLSKQKVDIKELLLQVVSEQRLTIKDHPIRTLGLQSVIVEADPDRIRQVLVNLLVNASNYSERGSKIVVTQKTNAKWVLINVRDYGIGISKKYQREIFKPYQRIESHLTRKHAGLGMGLYISSGIVSAHGGSISVTSTKGKGSTFTFSLPR